MESDKVLYQKNGEDSSYNLSCTESVTSLYHDMMRHLARRYKNLQILEENKD